MSNNSNITNNNNNNNNATNNNININIINSDDDSDLELEPFSSVDQTSAFDFSGLSASLYTASNSSLTSIVDLDGAELPAYVFRRRNAIIEESDDAPKAGAYVDYLL